jgi:hypothetical protein
MAREKLCQDDIDNALSKAALKTLDADENIYLGLAVYGYQPVINMEPPERGKPTGRENFHRRAPSLGRAIRYDNLEPKRLFSI